VEQANQCLAQKTGSKADAAKVARLEKTNSQQRSQLTELQRKNERQEKKLREVGKNYKHSRPTGISLFSQAHPCFTQMEQLTRERFHAFGNGGSEQAFVDYLEQSKSQFAPF
jgi:seryl-tRNA synthetase